MDWSKATRTVFAIKMVEFLQQEINLHIKMIAKTYETEFEVPCNSGVRGRLKCRKLQVRRWLYIYLSLSLSRSLSVCAESSVISLYDAHEAETLGRFLDLGTQLVHPYFYDLTTTSFKLIIILSDIYIYIYTYYMQVFSKHPNQLDIFSEKLEWDLQHSG